MIRVHSPIAEPAQFDVDCRQPGLIWLQTHAEGRRDLWSPFRDDLAVGFGWRCGYKAMLNLEGTVDHFVSIDTDRNQAYEWNNYRYISQGMNSSKKGDDNMLDPFEVRDNWFRLLLPSLQLELTGQVPANTLARAQHTINKLGLVNSPGVIKRRKYWYNEVAQNHLPPDLLDRYAPLVARAIREWLNQYPPPLPVLP